MYIQIQEVWSGVRSYACLLTNQFASLGATFRKERSMGGLVV